MCKKKQYKFKKNNGRFLFDFQNTMKFDHQVQVNLDLNVYLVPLKTSSNQISSYGYSLNKGLPVVYVIPKMRLSASNTKTF